MISVDKALHVRCSCSVFQTEACAQDSTMTELKQTWSGRKPRAYSGSRKQRGQAGSDALCGRFRAHPSDSLHLAHGTQLTPTLQRTRDQLSKHLYLWGTLSFKPTLLSTKRVPSQPLICDIFSLKTDRQAGRQLIDIGK